MDQELFNNSDIIWNRSICDFNIVTDQRELFGKAIRFGSKLKNGTNTIPFCQFTLNYNSWYRWKFSEEPGLKKVSQDPSNVESILTVFLACNE